MITRLQELKQREVTLIDQLKLIEEERASLAQGYISDFLEAHSLMSREQQLLLLNALLAQARDNELIKLGAKWEEYSAQAFLFVDGATFMSCTDD